MGVPGQQLSSWTAAEVDLLHHYFEAAWTKMTLYLKLQEIGNRHSYESMCRKIRKMRAGGHTRKLDDAKARLRIGYLDIEATHLNANFGYILSWYIKYGR